MQGLELYGLQPKQQGLALIDRRPHPVRWCSYSHESRMALLGTGEGGHWVQVTHSLYTRSVVMARNPAFGLDQATNTGECLSQAGCRVGCEAAAHSSCHI